MPVAVKRVSPSTAALDRVAKVPIYAQANVSHVWLVDPVLKTLEALRLEAGGYRLLGTWHADAKVRIEPFDAIELELSALWSK